MARNQAGSSAVVRAVSRVVTAALLLVGAGVLAGCGAQDDQSTVFILPSHSPTASAPATAATSPKASAAPTATPGATPAQDLPAATPIPGGDKIIIDSPNASTAIQTPVTVAGTASVNQGKVVAVVLGPQDEELGRATTTASAAAPEYGHFQVNVDFSGAASGARGKIKVFGVGRDGTTPTWYYFITVRFP